MKKVIVDVQVESDPPSTTIFATAKILGTKFHDYLIGSRPNKKQSFPRKKTWRISRCPLISVWRVRQACWFLKLAAATTLSHFSSQSSSLAAGQNWNSRDAVRRHQAWSTFRNTFVQQWFEIEPSEAVYAGDHRFDGKIADWSDAGLKRRANFLRAARQKANAFAGLDHADNFERKYLLNIIGNRLFWLSKADHPHRNPAWYVNGGLDPNVYLTRHYADLPTRMRALVAMLREVPRATSQIKRNLREPLPPSLTVYGQAAFSGFATYYASAPEHAFAPVADPGLHRALKDASKAASQSMRELAEWISGHVASTDDGFRLGTPTFQTMLRDTQGTTLSIQQVRELGEADLARNLELLRRACIAFARGLSVAQCIDRMREHRPEGGALAFTERRLDELRTFALAANVADVPEKSAVVVRLSPSFNSQTPASLDPPGGLESNLPATLYVTITNGDATSSGNDSGLGAAELLFADAHEGTPGHLVQYVAASQSASPLGRIFVDRAFSEGWAHYAEEMIIDAGFRPGDSEARVGQLSLALFRDCRLLVAIGVHTSNMSLDEAKRLFVERCFSPPALAASQARRAAYDPGYLNYTLGKLLIKRMRTDWLGTHPSASLGTFHRLLLRLGGPPLDLAAEELRTSGFPR